MNLKALKKRLSNPIFLAALAAAGYNALKKAGVEIDLGTYQLYVDLISYAAMGAGIYSSFETK
jgi:hypothetical protein